MSSRNPCCVSDFAPRLPRKLKPQSAAAISVAAFRRTTGSVGTPHLLLPRRQIAKQHLSVGVQNSPGAENSAHTLRSKLAIRRRYQWQKFPLCPQTTSYAIAANSSHNERAADRNRDLRSARRYTADALSRGDAGPAGAARVGTMRCSASTHPALSLLSAVSARRPAGLTSRATFGFEE